MKQWLKNLAIAGATAGAVVLGAASASAVSFTVVIDKIELMPNGNSTDRFVIYNPAAGIGASATSTLDLLNANKTGSTLPVAAPKSGTYNTMLVHFSEISIAAETATVSATQDISGTLGLADGFGTELNRKVLVMGDAGSGGGHIGALLGGGALTGTIIPMQPIVSNGSSVSLPAFDFFLPASNIVTSGASTVNVTKLPKPISVARTDVDSAAVPNVTIGVKGFAFSGTTAVSSATGTYAAKVGLFRDALDLKPVYARAVTLASATTVTSQTVTEVNFLDVADGTYLPLAWIDVDSDGLLDSGEPTIMATAATTVTTTNAHLVGGTDKERFLTISKADLFGASATTTGVVSSTSAAFQTSATAGTNTGAPLGSTGDNPTGMLGHSQSFFLFPSRAISLTVAFTEDGSATLDNGTDSCAGASRCGLRVTWTGGTLASNARQASMSFIVGNVTTPSMTMELDNNGGDANLDDAEVASLVIVDTAGAVPATSSSTLLTYSQTDANNSVLKISPVPLVGIKDLNINAVGGYGHFAIGTHIAAQENTGAIDGAIDTRPINAAVITDADVTLDGDAGGNFTGATLTAAIVHGNAVTDLSADGIGN